MPKVDLRTRDDAPGIWTPELVRDRMIEAVRWARYTAGPTGPAPIRSLMPDYRASLEDHLAEGWGLPEKADGVEGGDKVLRIQCSSAQVSQMETRLQWAADYLCPMHAGDARILNLWLRCKVYRLSFEAALAAQGWPLSRRHADRVKDRALSRIAQALQDRGIPK